MQHRNTLRALRTIAANSQADTKRLVKDIIRRPVISELLADVDKPKGVLCWKCKTGVMREGTTSHWSHREVYDLIIEHEPARICMNSNCREAIFSSEIVGVGERIIALLDEAIPKIQQINLEEITKNKCPLCQSDTLKGGHTGVVYRYRQALYHLRMKDIPLKAYCVQCGYEQLDEKVADGINDLTEELDRLAFQLMETNP